MNEPAKKRSLLELLIKKRQRKEGCYTFDDPIKVLLNDLIRPNSMIKNKRDLTEQVNELKTWIIEIDNQRYPAIADINFDKNTKEQIRTSGSRSNPIVTIKCETKYMESASDDLERQMLREERPKILITDKGLKRETESESHFYPFRSKKRLALIKKLFSEGFIPGPELYNDQALNRPQNLYRQISSINAFAKIKLHTELDIIVNGENGRGYMLNRKYIDFKVE